MKRLPIQAAKAISEKYKQDQVILVTWDNADHVVHVVSYGKTLQDCVNAADGANAVKWALGFPDEMCHDKPARARKKVAPQEQQAYLTGWAAGAGGAKIDQRLKADPVYAAGYGDGQNTRRLVVQRAKSKGLLP